MNYAQFEQVTRFMKKQYGPIIKDYEGPYAQICYSMDSNLLKTYWAHPEVNDHDLQEGFLLALHHVKSKITGIPSDVARFETPKNTLLRDALLYAFDPFMNPRVHDILENDDPLLFTNQDKLKEYYEFPVQCILKLQDSSKLWDEQYGVQGYFVFLQSFIGSKTKNDGQLNYSIKVSAQLPIEEMIEH